MPFEPEKQYPNFFHDLNALTASSKDLALVNKYLASVIDKLQIPHVHNSKQTSDKFFEHLMRYADELAKSPKYEQYGIKLDVFISGGVVRSLLANMYKYVAEQNKSTKPVEALDNSPVTALKNDLNTQLSSKVATSSPTKAHAQLQKQIELKKQLTKGGAKIPLH